MTGCDDFRDLAPALALGALFGDERGAAVSHLAGCSPCRRHLEGLAQVADDLLLVAPSVEPEIGFESRVMARLTAAGAFSTTAAPAAGTPAAPTAVTPAGTAAPAPVPAGTPAPAPAPAHAPPRVAAPAPGRSWARPRWRRGAVIGIAAAVIVTAALTGLWSGLTHGRQAGRNSALRQQATAANQLAVRTVVVRADGGRSTCQLVAFPRDGTHPARLIINLDEPGEPPGPYQVLAEPSGGGQAVVVGTIAMMNGRGELIADIPAGTGPVNGVIITDSPHSIKYHATFQPV